MTLAVAVCFPPQYLLNAEQQVPGFGPLERAVIIASDSLYSYDGPGKMKDLGPKIFPLATTVVAVIAGDVDYARNALKETKSQMDSRSQTSSTWEEFGQIAQSSFDRTIPRTHVNSGSAIDVECLIGIYSSLDDETRIIKLSTETADRFAPVFIQPFGAIGGADEAKAEFDRLYNDKTRLGGGSASPQGEGLRVIEALQSTVKVSREAIDGPIQSMILHKGGIQVGHGYEIGSSTGIARFTATPDELEERDET